MFLDSLSRRERQGAAATLVIAVTASLAVGYMGAGMTSPTGAFAGETASTDEISSTVQEIMDSQLQQQEQRLSMMAQRSENVSEEDLYMEADVEEVTQSDFPSLYKATVSVEGQTMSRTGETQPVDEEQVMYISKDGRYLFQQPTDLEQMQQQPTEGQQPQQPSSDQ